MTKAGDLVLVDPGAGYQGYTSNITCTFAVNGKFSQTQREIYEIILTALNTGLTLYRPWRVSIYEVMTAVIKLKVEGLIKWSLLQVRPR
ncbi:MAG: M24 family metallopeptidase [Arsenophonus sp. NEOnobi-MAG3]